MTHQQIILEHLTALPAKRDEAWERRFLDLLPSALVNVIHQEPRTGPDSWPYLFVEVSESSDEPAVRVLEWLSERGIGMAINPMKAIPDYVLSYGMIWNYRVRGRFLTDVADSGAKELIVTGNQIYIAPPTEDYLPKYVREILRTFFEDQKVLSPRVTLISQDKLVYDIAFSVESLGSPPEKEHSGISEAISWFLPAHFGIVLVSEKKVSGFVEL
jgi:hypothetical protein